MTSRSHKRRTRHDIIIEILQNAKNGTKKSHIMYQVGLNYRQNEQYLEALKEASFITEKKGIWKTTEKGFHVIEACELCQRLTEIP